MNDWKVPGKILKSLEAAVDIALLISASKYSRKFP